MSFDIVHLSDASLWERILKQNAWLIFGNIEIIWQSARKAIAIAQDSQFKQANKYRNNISYILGDIVSLSTKNIITDRLSQKLDHQMLNSFEIIGNK